MKWLTSKARTRSRLDAKKRDSGGNSLCRRKWMRLEGWSTSTCCEGVIRQPLNQRRQRLTQANAVPVPDPSPARSSDGRHRLVLTRRTAPPEVGRRSPPASWAVNVLSTERYTDDREALGRNSSEHPGWSSAFSSAANRRPVPSASGASPSATDAASCPRDGRRSAAAAARAAYRASSASSGGPAMVSSTAAGGAAVRRGNTSRSSGGVTIVVASTTSTDAEKTSGPMRPFASP